MLNTIPSTKKSQELYHEACKLIPGGVNSPVRSFESVEMEPLFISKASGPYIWDVDHNQYIDYVCSWGALIHGHAPKEVLQNIQKVISNGTSFGAPHENEVILAKIITEKITSIEKVRLVNSGTEAVMTAIRLARAFTRRNKIIKFEGCYHGHSDPVLSMSGSGIATFGIPSSPGVTKNTASETITIPFNDIHTFEITFNKFPKEIAAVIVEPVIGNSGVITPQEKFLKSLRELSIKFGSLLIFDEVITGFRLSLGGAQDLFNISADLTTLGKIIGGGMPIGAVGGKKEIMDFLAPIGPVYQAGTLSGNPISVACGIATLSLINEKTYEKLENLSILLCDGMQKINTNMGINVQINRIGSMFSLFFTARKVFDFKSAQQSDRKKFVQFFQNMLNEGIYLAPSPFEANFISSAHKEEDIEKTLIAYRKSVEKLQITNNL